jgi:MFS family permease
LGVGAGMIIPLSKGLIAIYFSGEQRQRQLGISSGVTNTSLVLATIITGELADIDWHWAFLVYMFSLVSLVLVFTLKPNRGPQLPNETLNRIKSETPTPIPHDSIRESTQATAQSTHFRIPWALMWFYFTLCVMVLAIPIELSLFLEQLKIGTSADSGTLIAAFFLAITIPGFTLSYFIKWWGKWINIISTLMIVVGIGIFLLSHNLWALAVGAVISGFGYGIMQPMVYEKAVRGVSKHRATYSLSWVMTMNYLSIIFYPVALKWLDSIFSTQSVYVPFIFSFVISVVMLLLTMIRRRHSVLGSANGVQ